MKKALVVMPAVVVIAGCATAPKPVVGIDHLIISTERNAPQRSALERAGFRIAPGVNEHEGQGTASITIEFQNAFLELLWPDERVPLDPQFAAGFKKFQERSNWRTSGRSPFGIALHRTRPGALPVPSWSIALPWMDPGTAIEMLTPRDDPKSPSVSVHPHVTSEDPALDTSRRELRAAGALDQPNGVKRLTAVRLTLPPGYEPNDALRYLRDNGLLTIDRGNEWAIELTFDRRAQKIEKDFRPELPLRVRY